MESNTLRRKELFTYVLTAPRPSPKIWTRVGTRNRVLYRPSVHSRTRVLYIYIIALQIIELFHHFIYSPINILMLHVKMKFLQSSSMWRQT